MEYFLSIQTIVSNLEVDLLNGEQRLKQYLKLRDGSNRSVSRKILNAFVLMEIRASSYAAMLCKQTLERCTL